MPLTSSRHSCLWTQYFGCIVFLLLSPWKDGKERKNVHVCLSLLLGYLLISIPASAVLSLVLHSKHTHKHKTSTKQWMSLQMTLRTEPMLTGWKAGKGTTAKFTKKGEQKLTKSSTKRTDSSCSGWFSLFFFSPDFSYSPWMYSLCWICPFLHDTVYLSYAGLVQDNSHGTKLRSFQNGFLT